MLEFKYLDKNVQAIAPYIDKTETEFCNISLGVKYMWRKTCFTEYAIFNDTLILREKTKNNPYAFYYPMGKDIEGALREIEEYQKAKFLPLIFCCVDNATAATLTQRYHDAEVRNSRDWSDYVYEAGAFKSYSGKRLSGQRNHVNKFKKTYPDYEVEEINQDNLEQVKAFLREYEKGAELSMQTARNEQEYAYDFIENMFSLNQKGICVRVDKKIVGISVGERVKDTLIVHIEKALKEYSGVYPTVAQEFAKAFATNGVKLINREEDCGDMGLRTSKLQYRPLEIKEKNTITVNTLFDKIQAPVYVQSERLTITDIQECDKDDYFRLYTDQELNKYWGYDYNEDLGGEKITPDYFYRFQNLLKQTKEEYSLAVRVEGKMIGELVLHNFGYKGDVEMGFRFFKEHQGKGYATESALALKEYVQKAMGARILRSRCAKKNLASNALITRLGLKQTRSDDVNFYFATEL